MVDVSTSPSQSMRLLKNNIEEDWIGFLQHPNISDESLEAVATFLANVSIFFDDSKKKKYSTSKGLAAVFERLLFRPNRFSNYRILAHTVQLLRNFYGEEFLKRVVTWKGYNLEVF